MGELHRDVLQLLLRALCALRHQSLNDMVAWRRSVSRSREGRVSILAFCMHVSALGKKKLDQLAVRRLGPSCRVLEQPARRSHDKRSTTIPAPAIDARALLQEGRSCRCVVFTASNEEPPVQCLDA